MSATKTSSSPTSDVLAKAAAKAGLGISALKAARSWLAEQFVAHEYAKLGQGGHTNTQVPLRQVFIDLPVIDSPSAVPQHEPRAFFLFQLLSSAPLELRNALSPRGSGVRSTPSLDDNIESDESQFENDAQRPHHHPGWGATLLIGGPGQGKSTLGQLACQLHRAALLKPVEAELTTAQSELVRSFVSTNPTQRGPQQRQLLGLPKSPFLPLQIVLPDLAAWLAKQQTTTKNDQVPVILRFLADLPSAKTCGLSADHLLALASHMPSLLVLDGFDEVGATQERERIVAAARDLLAILAQRTAASQVVATTRPQGYADELAQIGIRFEKRYLAPLLREEALEYARKLVDAKIPGADQRETTLTRLHEAAAEPATERLLTTPLQVTILTALVQQLGRAPRERWNLFSRYFAYTYDREIERNTYASGLLADHRAHIERIHARVALLLQVGAERDGGASARMPRERLEEVIEAVLAEDEVSEVKREDLVRDIASAAEQRLVFLVEPEPGEFGFEIRSLQEFMAAWALTSGRDSEVEARLQQVAKAPMFRNVALFAASRLFSEVSPLRDVLAGSVCGSLDDDPVDELTRTTRAGALLALETLEEGAVLSQPKRARALMERAVGLLLLPSGSEHVRLARAANSDTNLVLQKAIEQTLGGHQSGQQFNAQAAWICLVDATNRDEKWAIALGDKFWPSLAGAPSLLDVCAMVHVPLGRWIADKIECTAATISPESFVYLTTPPLGPDAPPSWVSWLISVYGMQGFWRRRRSAGFGLLVTTPRPLDILAPPTTPPPAAWNSWIMAAQFEIEPSAQRLAMALTAIADGVPVSQWKSMQWRSSWPLATCLTAAETPVDLRRFAELLLLGKLGDAEDWRSAERSWKEKIDFLVVIEDLAEGLPWSRETIKRAPPFFAISIWKLMSQVSARMRNPTPTVVLQSANQAFHVNRSRNVKQRLAELCLLVLKDLPARAPRSNLNLREWVDASPSSAGFLVPRPKMLPFTDWIKLLDSCTGEFTQVAYANISDIFDALDEVHAHPVLLRLAVLSLELYSEHFSLHEIQEQLKPAQFNKAIKSLSTQQAMSLGARADMAILRLFLGAVPAEQDGALFQDIAEASIEAPMRWQALVSALHISSLARPRINALLVKTYLAIGATHPQAHNVVKQIRDALQKRTSDLDNHATWNRLALPLPHPSQPLQARLEGGIPSRPVRIESLELRDIGGLHNLRLSLKPTAGDHGQWVVILGPNGVGKTTLLRSLALAMRSVKNPAIWPKGAFANSWQRVPEIDESRTIDSSITVKLGDGVEHKTLIRPSDSISITQLPEQDSPRLFPLFAYGCRRGSALGGAARQVNLNDDDGPEVATLFDDGADLIQAETWLVSLEGDTSKNPRSKAIFDSVIEAMKGLLDLIAVEVADQKVWVTERGRPKLPFSSLSDGYLTSAGWFLDLVARWITLAERYNQPIEGDFLAQMRGLVLIDEIDLHLHPRWQIEIITRTRRLLPQMSFVVTTHNPLTLVGAKAEEIWVLSTEDGRVKATCGVETPMLLTGGQIYRRYFGIEDIYPDGLGRSLQRYSFLSGYALRNDSEQGELEVLQKQLCDAGLDPGWEVVLRTDVQPESAVASAAK